MTITAGADRAGLEVGLPPSIVRAEGSGEPGHISESALLSQQEHSRIATNIGLLLLLELLDVLKGTHLRNVCKYECAITRQG